jgi:hypothetical protein
LTGSGISAGAAAKRAGAANRTRTVAIRMIANGIRLRRHTVELA